MRTQKCGVRLRVHNPTLIERLVEVPIGPQIALIFIIEAVVLVVRLAVKTFSFFFF